MKKYKEFTNAVSKDMKEFASKYALSHVLPFNRLDSIERKHEHLLPKPYNWKQLHKEMIEALENVGFERKDYGIVYHGEFICA